MKKTIRSDKKEVSTKIVFILLFVVLVIYSLIMILSLLWGFMTSLKSTGDFEKLNNIMGLPNLDANNYFNSRDSFFKLGNYKTVIDNFVVKQSSAYYGLGTEQIVHRCEANFGEMLLNTLLYTVGGALIYAVMPAIAAYLCAKYNYKLSGILVTIYTLMMCMPIVGNVPFELTFLRNVGLYDSIWGNYVQKMTGGGMYFFVYLAYFKGTSETYREAAELDGASQFRIMATIYFPLAVKVMGTVFLVQFVALWNDYQTPLLYLPTHPTLAYGVYYVSFASYARVLHHTPLRIAGLMLLAIPIIILFAVFKDKLMGDISLGGIKE